MLRERAMTIGDTPHDRRTLDDALVRSSAYLDEHTRVLAQIAA
jgi:hypothetical protein